MTGQITKELCKTAVIYAIGDIHGQHVMLKSMLAKLSSLPLNTEDIVLFLGDYVDRGENSRAVLDMLVNWGQQRPNSVFLRGNHEQFMLELRDVPPGEDPAARARVAVTWLRNGGTDTLLSYSAPGVRAWIDAEGDHLSELSPPALLELSHFIERWLDSIPEKHWDFLRSTRMEYVTPQYHFVHAGLMDTEPSGEWDRERWTMDPRLWVREPFLSSHSDFNGRLVVFGHTPQRNGLPLMQRTKVGLDTGAVYGGPLTAGVFENRGNATPGELVRFIQIPFARALTSLFKPIPVDKSRIRKRASSSRPAAG